MLRNGQLFSNLARQFKSHASITMLQGFLKTRLKNKAVSDTTALFAAENYVKSIL